MSCFPILEGKAGDLQLLLLVFVVKIRLLVQKCEDLNDSVEKIADQTAKTGAFAFLVFILAATVAGACGPRRAAG